MPSPQLNKRYSWHFWQKYYVSKHLGLHLVKLFVSKFVMLYPIFFKLTTDVNNCIIFTVADLFVSLLIHSLLIEIYYFYYTFYRTDSGSILWELVKIWCICDWRAEWSWPRMYGYHQRRQYRWHWTMDVWEMFRQPGSCLSNT